MKLRHIFSASVKLCRDCIGYKKTLRLNSVFCRWPGKLARQPLASHAVVFSCTWESICLVTDAIDCTEYFKRQLKKKSIYLV